MVARTEATLTKYTSLSAATAAGYTPATNPNRFLVHYANWQIAKTDGFDPSNPAFLMYANTVNGPKLIGRMYLGPGPLHARAGHRWVAHPVARPRRPLPVRRPGGGEHIGCGMCATGVHHTNTYFMLHVWTRSVRWPPPTSSSPT